MKRKSQITIFIIIGIILLLLIIILLLYYNKMHLSNVDDGSQIQLTGKQPVKEYIDSCIEEIVPEGIEIMRLQSGYIDIPSRLEAVQIQSDRTVRDNGRWKYVSEADGTVRVPLLLTKDYINIPTITRWEEELGHYVDDRLPYCLDNFSAFRSMDVEFGDINTEVDMGKSVIAKVNFPVEGRQGSSEFIYEEFIYDAPVNFKKINGYLSELLIHEATSHYLEDHVLQLISIYGYAGGQKGPSDLPPLIRQYPSLDCSYVSWNLDEVRFKLQDVFQANFGFLKMNKTRFEREVGANRRVQGVYDSFVRNYFEEDKSIQINFSYNPSWGIELDVQPKVGTSIRPDKHVANLLFIPMFCNIKYKFKYDIQAPVIATIYHNESANLRSEGTNGKGFEMNLAQELYLCGNQPRKCTGPPAILEEMNDANLSSMGIFPDTHYCENSDKDMTVRVEDADTGDELEGVSVYYLCGNYRNNCPLGTTDDQGELQTSFPKCLNGIIYFEKSNFSSNPELLTIDSTSPDKVEYEIYPQRILHLEVYVAEAEKLLSYAYHTQGFTNSWCSKSPEDLWQDTLHKVEPDNQLNEKVTVSMGLIITSSTSPAVVYPDMKNMSLGGGSYDMRLLYNANVTIHPSTYTYDSDTFVRDYDGDPLVHEAYKGKWLLGNIPIEWEVSDEEIQGKDTIEIYALAEELASHGLEVKDFDEPLINSNEVKGDIIYDPDCDGEGNEINVRINQSSLSSLLRPRLR